MGRKRDLQFCESAYMNNRTYLQYYNRLTELAISMFEWQNLPETVDQRFLEMCLFGDGMCVFFQDEVLGYLSLQCMIGGKLNVYRIPMERKAYATNGYQRELDGKLVNEWKSIKEEMTFLTKEQVIELFKDFEIIEFKEVEKDGATGLGKMKHCHIFNVIAKKK